MWYARGCVRFWRPSPECGWWPRRQAVMAELEHAFKFNDAVLRHLTVQKKKADTGPSSMMKTVEREEARKAQQAEATN